MRFRFAVSWLPLAAVTVTLAGGPVARAADAPPAAAPASPAPTPASPEEEFTNTNTDAVGSDVARKAGEQLGLEFVGYMRTGAYYANDNLPKGHYGLGELGYNRLGNEGDTYLEFGIGKKWDISGTKVGVYWMPYLYNAQSVNAHGTKQIYADIKGLSFAPDASFWGGQRYHRVQDVHIIDDWLMEDGDNFGAGVDGIKLGSLGTLNIAAYTEGTTDDSTSTSNANRLNFQWRDIPLGQGGKLTFTAGLVHGDFADKSSGTALGALYNQKLGEAATNSLFLQGSEGHANLSGKFYALNGQQTSAAPGSAFICTTTPNADGSCPTQGLAVNPNPRTVTTTTYNAGAKQLRVVDALNWQIGRFGGQAMIGYQTLKPSDTELTTKNLALGGRVSWGVAQHVKLYADMNYATLKTDGSDIQRLHKETLGVAVAPNTKFWTRPELRLYVSHVGGNDAVRAAGTFNGRSSATLAGLQIEAWWE
ncbi:MAG: carbohydrate porin [Proteobacteria bacterium]|nr:carbohydrate porin [Pseudomonadota bacterium]